MQEMPGEGSRTALGIPLPSTVSDSSPFQNMSTSKDFKAATDSAGCGGHSYKEQ